MAAESSIASRLPSVALRAVAAFVAALCAFAVAAPSRAAPDPYAIFERAESFWFEQSYPPYLTYDVAVTVDEGGSARVERYQSSFDATSGAIWVDPVSDYELAHPHVPRGINVSFIGIPIGKPEAPVDFIGVPILAPTYSFGMAPFVASRPPASQADAAALVAAVRRAFHDPYPRDRTPAPGTQTGLPEIAHVVTASRTYAISLLGEEQLDGRLCYHLALRALRDPGRNRLRELWVDESTGATWRLREALNFVEGPGTTVPWTVRFANVGGVQYISEEDADAPLRYRGLEFDHASVAFEHLTAVAGLDSDPVWFPPQSNLLREP